MAFHWDKLSPAEFQQLQDLAAYSTRKLQDVLVEFCGSNTTSAGVPKYHPDGEIDYEGFRKFLNSYLEIDTPDELCRHLFLSFVRKSARGVDSKAFKEMAVLSSTTACAAITSHTTSSSNVNSTGVPGIAAATGAESHSSGGSSLADKIHGITEKLQALSHHRTESEVSRTRTGSVHPMLTVTHTSYSCHDVLEKKSTDSSPSHSQMSRNSSRKSNNSLLVNNGKLEGLRETLLLHAEVLETKTAR